MQFLSDVYFRCPDCDGKRYRTETLDPARRADGTRKHCRRARPDGDAALRSSRGNSQVAVRLQPLVERGNSIREAGTARAECRR